MLQMKWGKVWMHVVFLGNFVMTRRWSGSHVTGRADFQFVFIYSSH